jgi:hypothetical protein
VIEKLKQLNIYVPQKAGPIQLRAILKPLWKNRKREQWKVVASYEVTIFQVSLPLLTFGFSFLSPPTYEK